VARVRAVARTVADLAARPKLAIGDLSQAMMLRGPVGFEASRLAS
jgi:predicted ATPase with chaperone activity